MGLRLQRHRRRDVRRRGAGARQQSTGDRAWHAGACEQRASAQREQYAGAERAPLGRARERRIISSTGRREPAAAPADASRRLRLVRHGSEPGGGLAALFGAGLVFAALARDQGRRRFRKGLRFFQR